MQFLDFIVVNLITQTDGTCTSCRMHSSMDTSVVCLQMLCLLAMPSWTGHEETIWVDIIQQDSLLIILACRLNLLQYILGNIFGSCEYVLLTFIFHFIIYSLFNMCKFCHNVTSTSYSFCWSCWWSISCWLCRWYISIYAGWWSLSMLIMLLLLNYM